MTLQVGISVHPDAKARIRIRDIPGISEPVLTIVDGEHYGTDLNVFFTSVQQLSALGQSISDYLANRFAMAPEVEVVA